MFAKYKQKISNHTCLVAPLDRAFIGAAFSVNESAALALPLRFAGVEGALINLERLSDARMFAC